MRLNTDLDQKVVSLGTEAIWRQSPAPGVERRMLYRDGDEQAIATSVVRYAPGSSFPEHVHDGGEEYLVLDGVFSDESGDHGKGTYVRNPTGSRHAPWTDQGATILVALRQFQTTDIKQVKIDTTSSAWLSGAVDGLTVQPLHGHGTEQAALVRWQAGTHFNAHQHWGGEEIYVVEGELKDEFGTYGTGTWLRSPHGSRHTPWTDSGALIFVKVGHLPTIRAAQQQRAAA